ncbi:hypothetical protein RRG08_036875 [Elysia crispata]|uniref:Uncharacterized protein n=1 Tax=Elysia crispata TaxID=231223 RepID=A0AAE1B0F9_9GAST|nr:hypothetical protein RRG08_036875 [Elysia crispata]
MNSLAEVSNPMERGGVVVLNNPRKGNNSGINEITKRHVGETLWRELKETTSLGLKWNNSPTAQQFTERLIRMLNKPDVEQFTSAV